MIYKMFPKEQSLMILLDFFQDSSVCKEKGKIPEHHRIMTKEEEMKSDVG
jgi:hypothetical protein